MDNVNQAAAQNQQPRTPAQIVAEFYAGQIETVINDFRTQRDLMLSGLRTELEDGTLEVGDLIAVQNMIHYCDELADHAAGIENPETDFNPLDYIGKFKVEHHPGPAVVQVNEKPSTDEPKGLEPGMYCVPETVEQVLALNELVPKKYSIVQVWKDGEKIEKRIAGGAPYIYTPGGITAFFENRGRYERHSFEEFQERLFHTWLSK